MRALKINALIRNEQDKVIIEFANLAPEEIRTVGVEFVLDFNKWGDLIGIEVINLKYHTGSEVLDGFKDMASSSNASALLTYEEASDAFYIKLSEERSTDQRVVNGCLVLDSYGRLVKLEANMS
jgi:uncharacterized protein YuzE